MYKQVEEIIHAPVGTTEGWKPTQKKKPLLAKRSLPLFNVVFDPRSYLPHCF